LFASFFAIASCLPFAAWGAPPDLSSIKIEDVAYGFYFGIRNASFAPASGTDDGIWELKFQSPEGEFRKALPSAWTKILSQLQAKPNGPWLFHPKESGRTGDFDTVVMGKFENKIEISVNRNNTFRSLRASFSVKINPDGTQADGEIIRAEIARDLNGQTYRQVFLGIPSDGGSIGFRMTHKLPDEIVETRKDIEEICRILISGGALEENE